MANRMSVDLVDLFDIAFCCIIIQLHAIAGLKILTPIAPFLYNMALKSPVHPHYLPFSREVCS